MMRQTDALGVVTMVAARGKDERPRPAIQPVGKSRQRQAIAVQHGDTLTSAQQAGSRGEPLIQPGTSSSTPGGV